MDVTLNDTDFELQLEFYNIGQVGPVVTMIHLQSPRTFYVSRDDDFNYSAWTVPDRDRAVSLLEYAMEKGLTLRFYDDGDMDYGVSLSDLVKQCRSIKLAKAGI